MTWSLGSWYKPQLQWLTTSIGAIRLPHNYISTFHIILIATKNSNYLCTIDSIRINKQSGKLLWSNFTKVICKWGKTQSFHKGNLIAHTSVQSWGPLHTWAKSYEHEIVRAQKKVSKDHPKTHPKHVAWSHALKCSVKSYMIVPSTKRYINLFVCGGVPHTW